MSSDGCPMAAVLSPKPRSERPKAGGDSPTVGDVRPNRKRDRPNVSSVSPKSKVGSPKRPGDSPIRRDGRPRAADHPPAFAVNAGRLPRVLESLRVVPVSSPHLLDRLPRVSPRLAVVRKRLQAVRERSGDERETSPDVPPRLAGRLEWQCGELSWWRCHVPDNPEAGGRISSLRLRARGVSDRAVARHVLEAPATAHSLGS